MPRPAVRFRTSRASPSTIGGPICSRIPQEEEKFKLTKSIYITSVPSKVTLILKGSLAVGSDSGLGEVTHVYKRKKLIFNCVLIKVDIQTDKNSYFKVQVLEADKDNMYLVFLAWGRIGTTIEGNNRDSGGTVVKAVMLILFIGSADYSDTEQHPETHPDDGSTTPEEQLDIGLIVAGVFITILGFVLLGLYIKVAEWRRNCVCPCTFSKKQSLARQLQGNSCGGQILALNPSTDPLVSHTQYAPVSEIPQRQEEEEERRNLMPDSKDSCLSSAEESDRMLDPDPRIVLRPIGNTVEDA
ncbi:poly [Culex quinquefasciatus]|uniref:NAD(+) ADP-ribosyltransferase n=1 Tax=Culex quinquefasciatus TaxID=7176 RepID=B0WV21_CULQU|nr:poly [Culex quinquefasciatus]|eukprot:XP_001871005.1 poly [Culex quinquefasciatus]